jgi:hypothetical protein
MSHDHAHHDHSQHGHGHSHAHEHAPADVPARIAADDVASVLMRGASARIGVAIGAIVLLWAAVAWALSDLTTI